jgi:hypothetical protein
VLAGLLGHAFYEWLEVVGRGALKGAWLSALQGCHITVSPDYESMQRLSKVWFERLIELGVS